MQSRNSTNTKKRRRVVIRERKLARKLSILGAIGFLLFATGCATVVPMYHEGTGSELAINDQAVGFMTIRVSNQFKDNMQPDMGMIRALNSAGKVHSLKLAKPFDELDKVYKYYLVSFKLAPGTYSLEKIIGWKRIPLLVNATCVFDLNKTVTLEAKEMAYLGGLDIVIREKLGVGEEPPAGPPIPLIDQAVAGFSTGTYDLKILDKYDTDVAIFRENFPFIGETPISSKVFK